MKEVKLVFSDDIIISLRSPIRLVGSTVNYVGALLSPSSMKPPSPQYHQHYPSFEVSGYFGLKNKAPYRQHSSRCRASSSALVVLHFPAATPLPTNCSLTLSHSSGLQVARIRFDNQARSSTVYVSPNSA